MDSNICYFYTDTIYQFHPLLKDDNIKSIIIDSWRYLVQKELVEIYGYVIMPNHIHLLWNILDTNGKESPAGSFAKHTAHQFKKYLTAADKTMLETFKTGNPVRIFLHWTCLTNILLPRISKGGKFMNEKGELGEFIYISLGYLNGIKSKLDLTN